MRSSLHIIELELQHLAHVLGIRKTTQFREVSRDHRDEEVYNSFRIGADEVKGRDAERLEVLKPR